MSRRSSLVILKRNRTILIVINSKVIRLNITNVPTPWRNFEQPTYLWGCNYVVFVNTKYIDNTLLLMHGVSTIMQEILLFLEKKLAKMAKHLCLIFTTVGMIKYFLSTQCRKRQTIGLFILPGPMLTVLWSKRGSRMAWLAKRGRRVIFFMLVTFLHIRETCRLF